MLMSPPVVDQARMDRLKAPEVHVNMNTVCIIFIGICMLFLYKRYKDVNQSKRRYDI